MSLSLRRSKCLTPLIYFSFSTKWKRQASLGLEILTETPQSRAASPAGAESLQSQYSSSQIELYYRQQLRNLQLPLLSPLLLQHTQYSTYLAQLAARARSSSSSSQTSATTRTPTSSPTSQRSTTPISNQADSTEMQSTKTDC